MFQIRATVCVEADSVLHDESWTRLHLFVNPSDIFSKNSYTDKLYSAKKEDQYDNCRIAKWERKPDHLQHRIRKTNQERGERDGKSKRCAKGKRVVGKAKYTVESDPQRT